MNNHRLLRGLLCATLWGVGTCAFGQEASVMTLDDIFQYAEEHSVMLRPSLRAEEEARHERSIAGSQRLPDVNASLSISYIGDGFTTKRNFTDYQKAAIPHFGNGLGITVTQPIYTGGAVSSAIDMAELKSTASRYATDLQRDNIRFRLTRLYLDIYKYSNLRTVVEQSLNRANKVLEDMRARYEQGTALRNDITRYELLVEELNLRMIKLGNTINILNRDLVVTAGLPEATVVTPDSSILTRSLALGSESQWQQEAAVNSPSLRLARQEVEIGRKAESLVNAERLPKIGLQAGWTIDGPILVEVPPINRNLSYWHVGLNVSYNLASLYKSNKSLAKSRATTLRMKEQLDVATEEVGLAVRTDYTRYQEAYDELHSWQKNAELADRNYNTTFTRYSAGMALLTDMLDAANAKLDAEQQLVNARINIIYYYYKLLFISGTI